MALAVGKPDVPAVKGRHKNLGCTLMGQLARRRRFFL